MARSGFVTLSFVALAACASAGKEELAPYTPDAPSGDTDASIANQDSGVPDTTPACTKARSVFLNFGGVSLTRGTPSNSATNVAAWMNQASGTAPAWGRPGDIATITNGITSALASLNVDIVTTRPTSGDYMMIVFGGTMGNVGSSFTIAVQQLDCGNLNNNDVAWVAGNATNQQAINYALGAIGYGVGLTATNATTGCMCGWGNGCNQNTNQLCALSASIGTNNACAGQATQNEPAAIQSAFCQ